MKSGQKVLIGELEHLQSSGPAMLHRSRTDMPLLIIAVAIVALALLLIIRRTKRSDDAVSDFRRQINALSPDARKNVTERVRQISDESSEDEEGESNGS
jgi:hypothetical protein